MYSETCVVNQAWIRPKRRPPTGSPAPVLLGCKTHCRGSMLRLQAARNPPA